MLDGTGSPDFRADVALSGDTIVAVGKLGDREAKRVIDAAGRFVVPGFIDMHSHADDELAGADPEGRAAPNLVVQGVTTVVVGADGRNVMWPISKEMEAYRDPGTALNVVPMVGHAEVRTQIMGADYERHATPDEIARMKELVRQGMEDGAWGMGAGPEYRPGRFSTTEELIELAKVVAEFDGFYYAHQRSQSPLPLWQTPSLVDGWRLNNTDGMKETIRIGREAGIRVVGSHIKAKGPTSWGHSSMDRMLIETARAEGVQVYLDQYPYETFGGSGRGVLPLWAFAPKGTDRSGGLDDPRLREPGLLANHKENLRDNLEDPETGAILREDTAHILDMRGGADRQIIVHFPEDPSLVGRTLSDVAAERDRSIFDLLIDFALAGDEELLHGMLVRPVAGHTFDVENYMQQEYTATSTDGGIQLGEAPPGRHPRYWGTYPRKIAYYVREKGVITLPFAIRSSHRPARSDHRAARPGVRAGGLQGGSGRLRLPARPGPARRILEPGRPPVGIDYVFVNGQLAVDGGRITGALDGVVIDRNVVRPAAGTTDDP